MEKPERQISEDLKNVRDKFMDYIGNPLNGVLGYYDTFRNGLGDEINERMLEGLKKSWKELFIRITAFHESGFESTGGITKESLQQLLAFKDKDPLGSGVIEALDNLYQSIIKKE